MSVTLLLQANQHLLLNANITYVSFEPTIRGACVMQASWASMAVASRHS